MNWFKSLFKNSNNELPAVTLKEEVDTTSPNISEPVYSFVETVRKHPGRFATHYVEEDFGKGYGGYVEGMISISAYILDKKTKEYFDVHIGYMSNHVDSWLTTDEKLYLLEEIRKVYQERKAKLEAIKQQRKARQHELTRQKYIKIYCEEGE
tara:strand:+ start:6715 stop:7170 length:456 start_codon:yes stop_codon:yes gene_type:complete